jgi:hypothetical protein
MITLQNDLRNATICCVDGNFFLKKSRCGGCCEKVEAVLLPNWRRGKHEDKEVDVVSG